jgi:hypothetical protein
LGAPSPKALNREEADAALTESGSAAAELATAAERWHHEGDHMSNRDRPRPVPRPSEKIEKGGKTFNRPAPPKGGHRPTPAPPAPTPQKREK